MNHPLGSVALASCPFAGRNGAEGFFTRGRDAGAVLSERPRLWGLGVGARTDSSIPRCADGAR